MAAIKPPTSFRTPQRPRIFYWHYAWVIVTIIAVMQMAGSSVRMAFGVFIEPLSTEFGWSQGSITLAYALSSVVTALASPMAGTLGDRIGARKAMIIGCTMFIIGVILTGVIDQVWQLYVTFGVMLGIAQAIFLVPLIPSAMTWFRRHLGTRHGNSDGGLGTRSRAGDSSAWLHDRTVWLEGHLLDNRRRLRRHNGWADCRLQEQAVRPRRRSLRLRPRRPRNRLQEAARRQGEAVHRVHAPHSRLLESQLHTLPRLRRTRHNPDIHNSPGGQRGSFAGRRREPGYSYVRGQHSHTPCHAGHVRQVWSQGRDDHRLPHPGTHRHHALLDARCVAVLRVRRRLRNRIRGRGRRDSRSSTANTTDSRPSAPSMASRCSARASEWRSAAG